MVDDAASVLALVITAGIEVITVCGTTVALKVEEGAVVVLIAADGTKVTTVCGSTTAEVIVTKTLTIDLPTANGRVVTTVCCDAIAALMVAGTVTTFIEVEFNIMNNVM